MPTTAYWDTLDPANRRLLEKYGGGGDAYVPPGIDTTSAVTTEPAEPAATAQELSPTNERLFKKYSGGEGLAETAGQIRGAYRGAKAAYRKALPGMPWPWRPMEWMFQPSCAALCKRLTPINAVPR